MNLTVRLKACVRLVWAVWHIFAGFFTILVVFPRVNEAQREQRVQVWSQGLLAHLGIEMQVVGHPVAIGPVMLVANHISWLDIASMHAARFCRFVSKADVKRWPVIGTLASGVGTLFIERESRRDAMRVVHQMADRLRGGDVLGVFPEGTTSDGLSLLPFHANLFQAAIAADAPVQPVAIQFIDKSSGQVSLAPCYIGDDTLFESLWRTVCAPGVVVVMTYGEPQFAQGRDRRLWAQAVRQEIAAMRRPD